jgi:hypothetical protein
VQASWRWRLLAIRAEFDAEIQASGGVSTEVTESLLNELTALYHTGEALLTVTPPTREALFRISRQDTDL